MEEIYDRTKETAAVLRFAGRENGRMLLVIGESGCGKSKVVAKALAVAEQQGSVPPDAILSYRFERQRNEGERFPEFLMEVFAQQRPFWSLDRWMRARGLTPESMALRLPLANFSYQAPSIRNPYKSKLFFESFSKRLGHKYRFLRLENVEDFGDKENLRIIENLALQSVGPKLIVEIGTLHADGVTAREVLVSSCHPEVLDVPLFDAINAERCYRYIHKASPPSSIYSLSRGNPLAIRHHGTTLAKLPGTDRIRERLDDISIDCMTVICCLVALRGVGAREFLEEVSDLGTGFEAALLKLRRADIVVCDENTIRFNHSLLAAYFNSPQYTYDVEQLGRRRIIAHLESQPENLARDRELAQQHLGIGEHEAAWQRAFRVALASYRQEDFRTVIELGEILDACRGIPPLFAHKANMLLLQTAVRTGDRQSFVDRVGSLTESRDKSTALLRAQGLYLMNRFQEAIELCGQLAPETEDSFFAARALGIRAAALIALGRHEQAADDYAVAQVLALSSDDHELGLELFRLSPELERPSVWRLKYDELKASRLPDRYPYLYAKCMHNVGAFLLMQSAGQEGGDELDAAAEIFTNGRYPEYSYAATMVAARYLFQGLPKRAETLLKDAAPWCHEQYDSFAHATNLGVAAALQMEWSLAKDHFDESLGILHREPFPLADPYFLFQAHHNLAVASAASGCFREALQLIESTAIPPVCHHREAKIDRRARLITQFRLGCFPRQWLDMRQTHKEFPLIGVMEIATLQFFDFNVNTLPASF